MYHADPQGEGSWNSVTTFRTLNSEVEEITLEQVCDSCPVANVVGKVSDNRKQGFAVHAHVLLCGKMLVR